MFARKFRSGKETFVELLFLPNFLYFRKSVLKKLRVKYIDGATCCRPSMVVQATKKIYILWPLVSTGDHPLIKKPEDISNEVE